MEKFIIAGSTALRYRDIGSGEKTVLLIHGYLGSIEIWDDFAGQLGKEFRVLAFDVPGHGISEVLGEKHTMAQIAEIAMELLKKIGVDKVTVIGHSMGGYIALELAAQFPELIDKLILFHSSPDNDTAERSESRKREINAILAGRKELITSTHPLKMFAPQNAKRFLAVSDEISEQAMLTEEEGMVALLRGMGERRNLNDILKTAPFKQLFVFGKHDQILSLERAKTTIANNGQAEVLMLENSGHIGFVEEQDLVLEHVKSFIAE